MPGYYGGYLSSYRYRSRNCYRRRCRSSDNSISNNEYEYGPCRRRKPWWEREDDVTRCGMRNRRRRYRRRRRDCRDRSPSPDSDGSPPCPPRRKPKPKPPKEELVKVLNVKGIDLHIGSNAKKHRTDQYACTEDRKDKNGEHLPAELIVRRGDSIKMTIKFDRPFKKKKHDMKIVFSVGENPTTAQGTLAEIEVDESRNKTFEHNQWGASLREKRGNDIDVEVFIPSNCIVGEWNLAIKTLSTGKDKTGKTTTLRFTYTPEDDVTILFNAWCKHDPVYMPQSDLLEEYVLNETGIIYRGSYRTIGAKWWLFGQYEPGILDASLAILFRGFNRNISQIMANPVSVARAISRMINAPDDNGVLVGNWSGEYEGGTSPTKWVGSVKILNEFMTTGEPVKFGQCWVFSALTTTVCRALGIPVRSVTNFASAHDTDESATIDKFYNNAEEEPNKDTSDSVWNFHVWNEVWMTRPDLDGDEFDGWQVIDATPQERSAGLFQCGPCPVSAVRRGLCKTNYDTCFVYSEVNADKVHWLKKAHGYEVFRIDKTSVGRKISTKTPGEFSRLDITDEYKPPEGTEEERLTMLMAYSTAGRPKGGIYDTLDVALQDMSFELLIEDEVMVGQDLKIAVKVTNSGIYNRTFEYLVVKALPMMYSGRTSKPVFYMQETYKEVKPAEVVMFEGTMRAKDYLPSMLEMASYSIWMYSKVLPVEDLTKTYYITVDEAFRFRRPDLTVSGPEMCTVGEPVEFKVTFTNPLPEALTWCDISAESTGFDDMEDQKQPNVPPYGQFVGTFKLTPNRRRKHAVAFSFDSKELRDISGAAEILVT